VSASISPGQFLDPIWRINNLYWCLNKKGQLVPFRLWDEQREFLTDLHSRNDILKCRQRGFTTLMGIVQLDDCVFAPNVRAAIIAHRMDDAKVIFRDKVKLPYDNLPAQLRASVPAVQDSADTLTLGNNSSFRVSTSVRSGTGRFVRSFRRRRERYAPAHSPPLRQGLSRLNPPLKARAATSTTSRRRPKGC
jgi:hypothetical protein